MSCDIPPWQPPVTTTGPGYDWTRTSVAVAKVKALADALRMSAANPDKVLDAVLPLVVEMGREE